MRMLHATCKVSEWDNSMAPRPLEILYNSDVPTSWVGIKPTQGGLVNMGNSCFINATLQALMHLPAFVHFLNNDHVHRTKCFSLLKCVTCALYRTYLNMSIHTRFKPTGLVNVLPRLSANFKSNRQEDAQEFLIFLFSFLEEEFLARRGVNLKLDYCSKQTTPIGQIFGWWMKYRDSCLDCHKVQFTYAPISFLAVPIQLGSIQGAINQYFQTEEVIDNFTCPNKCSKKSGIRTLTMFSQPKVFAIVLNRFDNDGRKISDPMSIEKVIEIKDGVYHLASCVLHEGNIATEGHYTCLAVRPNGDIMHYDDAVVSNAVGKLETLKTQRDIYIGFYLLHHIKASSIKRMHPTPVKSPPRKKLQMSPFKKSVGKKSNGKGKSFTPRKFKRKLVKLLHAVIPCSSLESEKICVDPDVLVEPLPEKGTSTDKVSPVIVKRRRKLFPKSTYSESSHEYEVLPKHSLPCSPKDTISESTDTAVVTPIKIKRPVIHKPKALERQSDHNYCFTGSPPENISEATDTAVVTPIKIRRQVIDKPTEFDYQLDHKACSTGSPPEDISNATADMLISQSTAFGSCNEYELPSIPCTPTGSFQEIRCQVDTDKSFPEINSRNTKFVPVNILSCDVPEASLPQTNLEDNTVPQLKRWLKLRGVPVKGNKPELIAKVKNYMNMNGTDTLDPKVDGGIFYQKQVDKMLQSQDVSSLDEDQLFPFCGWDIFPSRDMPHNFNFGSIYHYLVETMPQMNDIVDHSEDSDSGDEVELTVTAIGDPFEDNECAEINGSKKLRRGLQYVKSNHVRNMQDTLPDRIHFFKGQVRASMVKKFYLVKIAISQVSGSILKAVCSKTCPQRTLGRCSHISALLMSLLLHKNLNGPGAISCTSKPCTWNAGSLKRDPSVANQRQYESFKINVLRRSNFDPRPTKFQAGPSRFQRNSFLTDLQYKEVPSLFERIMILKYDDFTYDDVALEFLAMQRTWLYDALSTQIEELRPSPNFAGAFEVEGTRQQSSTDMWKRIRSLNCTAQPSRQIDRFESENAKMNFLRKHLWGLDRIKTKAMSYGIRYEGEARLAYARNQYANDPTSTVQETGLYLHTGLVGLSCSPDGIKSSMVSSPEKKLLEIKILYSMRTQNPNDFEQILNKKKLKAFCLERNEYGNIQLKVNHPYYDQVQFSMGMLDLHECDLFIYTKKGSITVAVPFNEKRWEELRSSLQKFHWEYLSPEYFAQRTPRKLSPVKLS